MTDPRIRNIVIVGGGTAGWMAAAAFAKVLDAGCSIRLVESEEIGTVGVGEGTVPHLKLFNNLLGIDDVEFVRNTQGTFKLGVQFNDWGRLGDSYVHGFGTIGHDVGLLPFHQYWIKARQAGKADEIGAYSLNTVAAPRGRFMPSASDAPPGSPLANVAYAYHFDAGRYARFLRGYAEQRGVRRTEGKVAQTVLRAADGFVEAIVLESGERIEGELFIDCSGFRGLLIEQALHTGYLDFSHWLPCDRALAVACEKVGPPTPYTRSSARPAGWQWRIPLQHRTGNGYVYSSAHVSDDEAATTLLGHLDGAPMGEPRLLRFTTGVRRQAWSRNVVALGLAGGFLEPLESTSIYMIQSGITRLLNLFPRHDFSPVLTERYNAQSRFEYEHIRDFLILHYHATERDDTPFWNQCRMMSIPPPLADNIRLFRDSGRFFRDGEEMFATPSWVQVMLGQRIAPKGYHPLVDQMPDAELAGFMASVSHVVASCVEVMPAHQAFIDRCCTAPAMVA
ncbi:tryptophan halogenase [Rhodanobacter thiooxydans]|uniref:Tryptophan halogenase n=1 Tax=Rhodanobacter thiooxydans TaxID=416169 RepID=A0A154QHP0_9GAMM|nr:tryptophan halogenase family protein [Rhodanobacter thiooxydans]EIL97031.1 tryptophan halogenase [Rhodanobacter thiooxydans LCS2]KZC23698.1 tryptophan halogenase [Rhodanobacter thiooxydans]MCW0200943.1 tryptophan 7-halogenase [Rhodanobacter thiooxydans]